MNTNIKTNISENIEWKKELFTNPDITNKNIICNFKLSKKIHGGNKVVIASTYFLNRKLILGERNLMIISKLNDFYNIYNNCVIIIVRNDIAKDNFNIVDYSWGRTNFRIVVHLVRYKTFFDRVYEKNHSLDSDKDVHKVIIFQDYTWSEILLYFKLKGILVSGGDVVRRHSLSYNQYRLSLFIHLINVMNNFYINSEGIVRRKSKYNIADDYKFMNHSKEMYNTSNLDFRDAKFKDIMRSHIDFTHKKISDEIGLFLEYSKNKDEFIKYMENKKDQNMNLNNNNLINKPKMTN
uniref:Uncharacterized protein n=1 Tax=Tricholoma saponaceum TaxID=113602 RepID=A0A6C0W3S3_9AGAR|nr:hypothetical protein [Tricholoma saponaceum]QIC20287.1 hypothetical protein [Tricholoma saponaceum]